MEVMRNDSDTAYDHSQECYRYSRQHSICVAVSLLAKVVCIL